MTTPRYRLDAPDGGYWYCKSCQANDDWFAVLPEEARQPTAYQCGCGKAEIPAEKVTRRTPSDAEGAWLFETLNEWFERRIAELEWLHCRGAWAQAHALSRWLEGA